MFRQILLVLVIAALTVGCGQTTPKATRATNLYKPEVLVATEKTERQIPVVVGGRVTPRVLKAGEPIPLVVTVSNHLDLCIYHDTFSLVPIDWNGETLNISLVDIYRDDNPRNLYYARPKPNVPLDISGSGRHEIKKGDTLTIETDASKWLLHNDGRPEARYNGWLPGRYKVTLRVDNLTVDKYSTLSVLSDPVEFEIR